MRAGGGASAALDRSVASLLAMTIPFKDMIGPNPSPAPLAHAIRIWAALGAPNCAKLPSIRRGAVSETRKLASILVTDVVGYSRLAGIDEDRTLASSGLRSDLIDPRIASASIRKECAASGSSSAARRTDPPEIKVERRPGS
jgi:hypothetical protein